MLPRRAPEREAAEAVRELRPWIERRRRALARAAAEVARRAGTVPYLGDDLRLVPRAGPRARAPPRRRLLVPERRRRAPAIERWYRRAGAGRDRRRALDAAAARAGTSYRA